MSEKGSDRSSEGSSEGETPEEISATEETTTTTTAEEGGCFFEEHDLEPAAFLRPTCCNVCKGRILAVGRAYQCSKCSAVCHEGCRAALGEKVRCKESVVPAGPVRHQWMPYNMHQVPEGWPPLSDAERAPPPDAGTGAGETAAAVRRRAGSTAGSATACVVCGRDTANGLNPQCHRARCVWCWRTTHTTGSKSHAACGAVAASLPCRMGPLACFIAPPNLVVRDRSRSRSASCSTSGTSDTTKSSSSNNDVFMLRKPTEEEKRDGVVPEGFRPLVAFVNGRSGSREGLVLKRQLSRVLNPRQVFDLMEPGAAPGPQRGLDFVRAYGDACAVLACGGDGTFGWVLEALRARGLHPPVAVVPLGTGNDLARVLGWGGGFDCAERNVASVLLAMANPRAVRTVQVDRWQIHAECSPPEEEHVSPIGEEGADGGKEGPTEGVLLGSPVATKDETPPLTEEEEAEEQSATAAAAATTPEAEAEEARADATEEKGEAGPTDRRMNNYWSIGLDAGIALDFHHQRESNPAAFNSRVGNKVKYFGIGANQLLQADNHLSTNVVLTVDGRRVHVPHDVHCIVVLNLPSCYGGKNLWGELARRHLNRGFHPIAYNDGLVEVVGIRNMMHIANINTGVSMPKKLAQGRQVSLRILSPDEQRANHIDGACIFSWFPCQFDGEPYEQRAGQTITISHLEQANMICKL